MREGWLGVDFRGYDVYRKKALHGGFTYWIDDVGGGRCMFDEGVDDWELLKMLKDFLDKEKKELDTP